MKTKTHLTIHFCLFLFYSLFAFSLDQTSSDENLESQKKGVPNPLFATEEPDPKFQGKRKAINLFVGERSWSPDPKLQGEWVKDCHKEGDLYYFKTKVAFMGDVMVHSWKWYEDSFCKIKVGEHWDKWKVVIDGYVRNSPEKMFAVKMILLDGHEKQCPVEWTWISPSGTSQTLYFGEKYIGEEGKELACKEWPKELEKTPFIFEGPLVFLHVAIENYTNKLKREFSE